MARILTVPLRLLALIIQRWREIWMRGLLLGGGGELNERQEESLELVVQVQEEKDIHNQKLPPLQSSRRYRARSPQTLHTQSAQLVCLFAAGALAALLRLRALHSISAPH